MTENENRAWNAWLASRPTKTIVVGENADGTQITAEVHTIGLAA